LFIYAITYVPLADAVAVSFVAPFIVTVLGAVVLKEPVGIRRWLAVLIGFFGMLVVIRPGMSVFHPAIFLVVIAASCFAIRQLVSRWLSGVDSVSTTVAYTSVVAFCVTGLAQPFVWITPDNVRVLLIIVGLALSAAVGEVFIIRALDIAQSVHYLQRPSGRLDVCWLQRHRGFWPVYNVPGVCTSKARCKRSVIIAMDNWLFFDASDKIGPRIAASLLEQDKVIARAMPQGDILGFAPPFCLSRAEADQIVAATVRAVAAVLV